MKQEMRNNASLSNSTKVNNFTITESSIPKLRAETLFTHVHFKQQGKFVRTHTEPPSRAAKLQQLRTSVVSKVAYQPSMGVLLPICLLAIFLCCVVCVYRWQSATEMRMDIEDKRKRKQVQSRQAGDRSCVLRTYKPIRESLRGYPWNSWKIKELPDINNNVKFEIPPFTGNSTAPGYHSWPSHLYHGNVPRPATVDLPMMLSGHGGSVLKSAESYHSIDAITDVSGCCYSSEASCSFNMPSSSANTTKSFNEHEGYMLTESYVIGDDVYEMVNLRDDSMYPVVETLNGSLTEHWV